ncbi:hypothetical protein [Mycolicibacterium austroafricanum]|uniref:hypothetical protein n=1 Tax=Mycolicibacterium austroafricanum TaxID=39687 RepID=UPI0006853714|nr:hypothetical protein [Mycolicibacterium austroafricanum]
MSDTRVCIYANEVAGPFTDRTARLTIVGQFSLPNVGSTALTMEYVLGQINNETSAGFVAPTRVALAEVHGGDGQLREGDMVQINHTQFMVTADNFAEWSGE